MMRISVCRPSWCISKKATNDIVLRSRVLFEDVMVPPACSCHRYMTCPCFVVLLLLPLSSRVRLVMVTLVLSSSFLSFLSSPHLSCIAFSITSLQLLLSFAVVLNSPPTFSRSLLTQSSHRIPGLPRLISPSTLKPSALFPNFSFPLFPYYPTPH